MTPSGGNEEVVINANGQLGSITSSIRYKMDVRDIGDESQVLMSLRPVAFKYKPQYDPIGTQQYGLIAEEVEKVAPQLVVYDNDGQVDSVRYHEVNAMLLNEFQRQEREIEEQRSILDSQQAEILQHRDSMAAILARLDRLEQMAAVVSSHTQSIVDLHARVEQLEAQLAESRANENALQEQLAEAAEARIRDDRERDVQIAALTEAQARFAEQLRHLSAR